MPCYRAFTYLVSSIHPSIHPNSSPAALLFSYSERHKILQLKTPPFPHPSPTYLNPLSKKSHSLARSLNHNKTPITTHHSPTRTGKEKRASHLPSSSLFNLAPVVPAIFDSSATTYSSARGVGGISTNTAGSFARSARSFLRLWGTGVSYGCCCCYCCGYTTPVVYRIHAWMIQRCLRVILNYGGRVE